ncbi:hypothetical protein ECP03052936_5099, partial [Escherichia coli p0305293.6]
MRIPCRPDKRSASGSFAFVHQPDAGHSPALKITAQQQVYADGGDVVVRLPVWHRRGGET